MLGEHLRESQSLSNIVMRLQMRQYLPLALFICSVICILCVGFYPHLCTLLYLAFMGIFIALSIYTYEILKVKKQATIKAYYKLDSLLYRYFGRFFIVKIISVFVALVGSISVFLMLVFPSGSDILLLCLLTPCSVYALKIIYRICKANISDNFAPILAKKYTALICAAIATICAMWLNANPPSLPYNLDIQAYYEILLERYYVAQMPSRLITEFFGFVLLKKAVIDILLAQLDDSYLYIALSLLFICGYFASFASFALLCIGSLSLESASFTSHKIDSVNAANTESANDKQDFTQSRAFRQFFAMVFFLIFIYIAFNISIHLQSLAKHHKLPATIGAQILKDNEPYIQMSIQGVQSFIRANDIPLLQKQVAKNLVSFENALNSDIESTINEYLAHKEIIIERYSQWYFSVFGEYTRLFYAAIGRGEDIAQEQFITLLKAHTPYDLQERLNRIYDKHFDMLKARLEQSFRFYMNAKKPHSAHISQRLSFDDFSQKLDILNPRASDGIAALLGASVAGAMILKASGKAIAKSSAKVIGKSVAKKSLGGAIGAGGGSLLCGSFAPLCAIGFFVASDYAINSVDEALNEAAFKQQMRDGFNTWEQHLKDELKDYNAKLSQVILNNINTFANLAPSDDSFENLTPRTE